VSLWIESHADLRDHPKLDLLMDLAMVTRRDAVGLLHLIWWRALTYAPDGDLSAFTDSQVARWAEWDAEPAMLLSALKLAGFMDEQRTLHDWDDYAGRWLDRKAADAARKRAARHAANGVHATSPGRPAVPNLTGPNRTGPDIDRTQPDRTGTTPLPPPPAEGAPSPAERTIAERSKRRSRQPAAQRRSGIPTDPSAYTSGPLGQVAAERMAAKLAEEG
jgi:hypothetical protein